MKIMKSKITIIAVALLSLAAVTGCGAAAAPAEPTPEPTMAPTPTPEPTPIIPLGDSRFWGNETEIDLTGTGVEAPALKGTLRRFSDLKTVTISDCNFTLEEKSDISAAFPGIQFCWPVEVMGHTFDNTAETISFPDEGIDLSELAAYAPLFTNVKTIDLGSEKHEADDIIALREAFGGAGVICATNYHGVDYLTNQQEVDLTYGYMNGLAEIDHVIETLCGTEKLVLPYFTNLPNEVVNEYAQSKEDIRIVWTVHFLKWNVRTDITCFSSLQAEPFEERFNEYEYAPLLKYCTDLVALDLGHNDIRDLSDFANLKKLRYLIIADNQWLTEIPALGELTDLEYLELFRIGWIKDYSPLANLHKMVDLNISYSRSFTDASFVEEMPDLKVVWFRDSPIPEEQREAFAVSHPDTQFVYSLPGSESSTSGGWRATERNIALRTAFRNWRYIKEFVSWDNYTFVDGAPIQWCEATYW